jgi:ankyrin repeat protein
MKKAVLTQNPLSEEQALSKLAQFSSGNIRSHCEVVERAPQTAFTSDAGQQTFLSGVLYAVKLRETDAESVKRLLRGMLARGADPNKLGHDGHAAIHIVAQNCRGSGSNDEHCAAALEILIIDARTDVNLQGGASRDTAAHIIGRAVGHEKLLALLHACDKTIKNASGETVFDAIAVGAKVKEQAQIAAALAICVKAAKGDTTENLERSLAVLKKISPDLLNASLQSEGGLTLLGLAARDGAFIKNVSSLLDAGCSPDQKDNQGNLPDVYLASRNSDDFQKLVQQLFAAKRTKK